MQKARSSFQYVRGVACALLGTLVLVQCSAIHLDRSLKHQPEDWPMYGRVPSRTNTTREILRPPLTLAWTQDVSGGVGNGSPVLADSLVLVGTMRGELYAINAFTGIRIGWVDFGESIQGAPVITGNTVVVACSYTQESLSAFDLSEGSVRWKRPCGDIEASLLLQDTRVYVANTQGTLFCLKTSNGDVLWKYELPENTRRKGFRSAPAVGEGVVVAGGDDGNVYAWDPDTGTVRWRYSTGGSIAAPAGIADSTVFIGSLTGGFFALTAAQGNLRWKFSAEGSFYGGPCLVDDLVIVGTTRGMLFGLSATDGTLRWKSDLGGVINSSAVAAGRVVFVGTLKKQLYAIDARNGKVLWSQETPGRIKTSPAIAHHTLYVATDERSLLAFREVR
jgi:outer membrane protein assembly factor BamB